MSIKVDGLAEADTHRVIDAGFALVEDIHRLMSFHESGSDVSALNRGASTAPLGVSPLTYSVIRFGVEVSAASAGVFDLTVARQLVDWGFLPRPENAPDPDPAATWRDIELLDDNRIRFHRPLWIDLGGIAKGFAVDCAVEKITALGAVQCCVNAGGDLRVAGPAAERVLLRTDAARDTVPADTVPVLELDNGSLASSSGREQRRVHRNAAVGPHVDGLRGATTGLDSFVSVVAPRCIVADALTKVVLAQGEDAERLLQSYDATAYHHDARGEWRVIGTGE